MTGPANLPGPRSSVSVVVHQDKSFPPTLGCSHGKCFFRPEIFGFYSAHRQIRSSGFSPAADSTRYTRRSGPHNSGIWRSHAPWYWPARRWSHTGSADHGILVALFWPLRRKNLSNKKMNFQQNPEGQKTITVSYCWRLHSWLCWKYSRFPASAAASENSTQDTRKIPTILCSIFVVRGVEFIIFPADFVRRSTISQTNTRLNNNRKCVSSLSCSQRNEVLPKTVTNFCRNWTPDEKMAFLRTAFGVRKKVQSAATISWPNVDFSAGVELILHHYIMFLLYLKTEHHTVLAEINVPGA